jgi:hypothetical protein
VEESAAFLLRTANKSEVTVAFARIAVFPGGNQEQYEYLGELMGEGVAHQPERRLIAAGPSEDGWTIIQVWDSKEPLERFIAEHLSPAMEQAGDRGYPQPPTIADIELVDLHM